MKSLVIAHHRNIKY